MSSQEKHLNSGEVIISPEARSSVDTSAHPDTTEPAVNPAQAQTEEGVVQAPLAGDDPEAGPRSIEGAAAVGDGPAIQAAPAATEAGESEEQAVSAAAVPDEPEEPAAPSITKGAASAEKPADETPSSTEVAASAEKPADETPSSAEGAASAEKPASGPEEPADEILGPAEIASLMESIEAAPTLAVGEIVQGHVLKVTEDEVVVDLGLKCEAVIPRAEFVSEDGPMNVEAGETVGVFVEKFDELAGTAVVSRRKALQEELWEEVERAFYEEKPIRGRVVERVKGGLGVDVGIRAFMPASQADMKPHPNMDEWIGQEIVCKVIKLDRKRDNVVVSHRKALEEANEQKKAALLENLAEGAVLNGRVKNLTDYGAFVDLGGMDGLLHLTDLSWTRVSHPSEVVQAGQEVEVKVLKFDKEKGRVSLGLKQLTPDPWEQVTSQYHVSDRIQGKVVSVTDYGAFIELEPGVEGLVHISEMSWTRRLRHPSKILKPGEQVEVAVLDINPEQRRISLSLRQALPDPWDGLNERMGVGTIVKGRVRHFTDFGAFIEVEEGVDGLIHVSNLSWTRNVKHPSEMLRKGQEIEAVVLNVDSENRRLSLGLKQLQPDAWENFFGKTNVGDQVHAKVTRRTSFGVFAEIEEGIEGLCHISEIANGRGGSEEGLPKVGDELDFRVIRLNPEEKKISLSTRPADWKAPKEREKAHEPSSLSRMAEAFSSAGITTPAMARANAPGDRNDS